VTRPRSLIQKRTLNSRPFTDGGASGGSSICRDLGAKPPPPSPPVPGPIPLPTPVPCPDPTPPPLPVPAPEPPPEPGPRPIAWAETTGPVGCKILICRVSGGISLRSSLGIGSSTAGVWSCSARAGDDEVTYGTSSRYLTWDPPPPPPPPSGPSPPAARNSPSATCLPIQTTRKTSKP
jgi:hypothetical protein